MNLLNLTSLTIRVMDFNKVAESSNLIKKLRQLTLQPHSGMNYELNHMIRNSQFREVQCKILLAYRKQNLVAWALLSKEPTDFRFQRSINGYNLGQGILFQIFVSPEYRRQGIGTEIMKVARRKANGIRLCICPCDYVSDEFYDKFEHYNHQKL